MIVKNLLALPKIGSDPISAAWVGKPRHIERGKNSNCMTIEICDHCKDEKLGRVKHNWISLGNYELKKNGKRKCKDCGQMEV